MGLKPAEVIKLWPVNIFFVILSISLFYNFAIANGTLEKLSQHMLYRTRKFPRALPIVIFFASMIIAALGAGFFAVLAFFAPMTLLLCKKLGISPLIGALAVNYGALCGNNFMISAGGVVFMGLMEQAGYGAFAYAYEVETFFASLLIPLILLCALMLFSKRKVHADSLTNTIAKPESFDDKQRKTLGLIATMVFVILIFPLLHTLFPHIEVFKTLSKTMDIGLIAFLFTVLGLLLKIGDEREILRRVPWGTILMICGVGMLISIAMQAGTVKSLARWVNNSLPTIFVPMTMAILGSFMSFFSSTMGVVTPALFPVIPALVHSTGIEANLLFSAIVIGAQATAISPFSSGGSLVLASVGEEEREQMFTDLMFKGVPLCLLGAIFYALLVTWIL